MLYKLNFLLWAAAAPLLERAREGTGDDDKRFLIGVREQCNLHRERLGSRLTLSGIINKPSVSILAQRRSPSGVCRCRNNS